MEQLTLSAVVLASASIIGLIAKLIHSMRNDIRSCFCITFRTPTNSAQASPKQIIRPVEVSQAPTATCSINVPNSI